MNDENPTASDGRRPLGKLRSTLAVGVAVAMFVVAGAIASVAVSRMPAVFARHASSREVSTASAPNWRQVGVSVQGRPILMATFGAGSRRVLIIGGIHGSEYGSDVAEAFAAWLAANQAALPTGTRVDVVACANPDGRAADKKGNADGVNLNGNFPTRNWKRQKYLTTTAGPRAGSEPETQALMRLLETRYVRVVSLHSQGGFIDYDGPGGGALARQISSESGLPVKKLGPTSLYAGSLGMYVPERYGIPVLTFELTSRQMSPQALAGLLASVR